MFDENPILGSENIGGDTIHRQTEIAEGDHAR